VKRVLAVLVAVLLVGLVGRWTWRALASDETKIRWMIERTAEGFDDRRLQTCLDGFARDWRDVTLGVDREELKQALRFAFFQDPHAGDVRSGYRVRVPDEELRVEPVAPGSDEALVEFVAELLERVEKRTGGREPELLERTVWKVRVRAELVRGDGGWRFSRSEHESLEGRPPRGF
jgi:hypothetical protein